MTKEELIKLGFEKSSHMTSVTPGWCYAEGYADGRLEQQEIDGTMFQKTCNAINLMNYLDKHCPPNKMCLSNMECEDLENAFMSGDWAKVIRYIKKYQTTE